MGRPQKRSSVREARLAAAQSSGAAGVFSGCRVRAFLTGEPRFNRDGGFSISFTVSPAEVAKALVFQPLIVNPLPLTVDVQVAESAGARLDEVAEENRRAQLRALGDG